MGCVFSKPKDSDGRDESKPVGLMNQQSELLNNNKVMKIF